MRKREVPGTDRERMRVINVDQKFVQYPWPSIPAFSWLLGKKTYIHPAHDNAILYNAHSMYTHPTTYIHTYIKLTGE